MKHIYIYIGALYVDFFCTTKTQGDANMCTRVFTYVVYVHMYLYVYVHIHTHIYIYMYI